MKPLKVFTILAATALLIGTVPTQAKKNNNTGDAYRTESFEGLNFTKVHIGSHFTVELEQSDQTGVTLEMDPRLERYLECSIHNDGMVRILFKNLPKELQNQQNLRVKPRAVIRVRELEELDLSGAVRLEGQGGFDTRNLTITLTGAVQVKNLTVNNSGKLAIDCSGASRFESSKVTSADEIKLTLSGSANVNLTVNAPKINTNASGASKVTLAGKTGEHHILSSGSARVDIFNTDTERAYVDASGSSQVICAPKKSLNSQTSGTARVSYKRSQKLNEVKVTNTGNGQTNDRL